MNKLKGRKPTKKCVSYFRRMITNNSWKINEKIPTTKSISEKLEISYSTVRKTLITFEKEGILENYGSLGYFLKSKTSLLNTNKGNILFKSLKIHVEGVKMFREGAIQLQNWIVLFNKETEILTGLNIVSGLKLKCNYNLIKQIINKPVTLNDLLKVNVNEYKSLKLLYTNQQKLYPLAKLILSNKKDIIG